MPLQGFPLLLLVAIIIAIACIITDWKYKKSAYYQITKLPYISVIYDKGRYGEYLTYKRLKRFESKGAKFLFNLYIPKDNGETTEIDILMICPKGIFVFESKNYSGWIFGSEDQKNWCQTLPAGRGRSHKEYFYNPIKQNCSHMKHLKHFIGENFPIKSIIVFSDRCTLKNIQITNNDIHYVINRYHVVSVLSAICNRIPVTILSESDIANIYNKLYPCTQASASIKSKHIANIHNNFSPQSSPHVVTHVDLVSPILQNEKNVNIQNQKFQSIKCPKCGGNLILRTAGKGTNIGKKFYGCSNFPRCRYTQNIVETSV